MTLNKNRPVFFKNEILKRLSDKVMNKRKKRLGGLHEVEIELRLEVDA